MIPHHHSPKDIRVLYSYGISSLILKIRNGKIIEEREEADMLVMMMQPGMELKPKKGEK